MRYALVLLTLSCASSFAAPSQKSEIFKVEPGPPPGFESAVLKQVQTNVLDVYFNGQKVGSTLATFSSSSVEIKNPKQLVSELSAVSDKKLISHALAQKLETHEQNLCRYGIGKNYCKSLSPEVAGVILDPNKYRLYLFINPKYLKATKQQSVAQLGLPTATHSFIAKNNFIASGTRNDQNYSWMNHAVWAYRNTRAQLEASVQQNNNINGGTGFSQMTLQRASVGRLVNQTLYQVGQLNTLGGGDFITQQYFAGFGMRNFNTGLGNSNNYGSALPVFITVPSTVRVYRNGILIATEQLDAGRHFLNTSNFPSGSYDVKVQITQNTTGQVSTLNRYFSKETALPEKGYYNYAFNLGFLQRNLSFNQNKFLNVPLYRSDPILFLHNIYGVNYNLGLETDYLMNFDKAYLSTKVLYYGTHFDISPGALLATKDIYGLSLNSKYRFKRITTGMNFMRIWGRKSGTLLAFDTDSVFSQSNQPLTTNDMRLNVYANANIGSGDLYVGMIYTQDRGNPIEKDYTAQYSQPLLVNEYGNWDLSVGVTRGQGETSYSATVNYNFASASGLNASTSVGYSNNTSNSGLNQVGGDGNLQVNAKVSKDTTWNVNDQFNVAASVHRDDTSKYAGVTAEYINNYMRGFFNGQQSFASGNTGFSYSGELDTDIIRAQGHWTLGYDETRQTGVIVDVMSPIKTKVTVLVDGSARALISTNTATAIYLAPFKVHKITINPEGDHIFAYDRNARRVVLYRGNLQFLPWTLGEQYILFTKVVGASGKPIKEALLKAKGEYNATDDNGFIQANISTNTKKLVFEKLDGATCSVKIPADLTRKDNFAQVESLDCT